MAGVGWAFVVLGAMSLAFGVLWQLERAPGSAVMLPAPVALERAAQKVRQVALPRPTSPSPTPAFAPVVPPPFGLAVVASTGEAAPPLAPADAADRLRPALPETGYAVRLAIPTIKLDTEVRQAGIIEDARGELVWETMPFVAVHYGDLTSLIGAPGNAVIAGHVVTLSQGNVFRNLYQVELEDQVQVWDDQQVEHDFRIVDVRLVPPSDTSVMAPMPGETLTLITCGGMFDPVSREFSDRLIVTARPLPRD